MVSARKQNLVSQRWGTFWKLTLMCPQNVIGDFYYYKCVQKRWCLVSPLCLLGISREGEHIEEEPFCQTLPCIYVDPKGPPFCTLSPCHRSIWWDFKRPPWGIRSIYRRPYWKSSIKQKQSSWETSGAELKVIINMERGFKDTFHLENCTLGRLCLANNDCNSCRVQSRCCVISGDLICNCRRKVMSLTNC